MKKANPVLVRMGLEDMIITKEEFKSDKPLVQTESYFIGYEDEEGNECEEDGTYLD